MQQILQSTKEISSSPAASTTGLPSPVAKEPSTESAEEKEARQKKLDRIISVIDASVKALLRNRGLIPHYILRLTEDEELTPDNQLDAINLSRRQFLRNLGVKVHVNINHKRVTSSEYFEFRPQSPIADIKKHFEFRLVHQPSDITLEIVCKRFDSLDQSEKFLTSISIPFPGQQDHRAAGYETGTTAKKAKNMSALSTPAATNDAKDGTAAEVRRSSYQQPVAHSFAPNTGWFEFCTEKLLPSPITLKDIFMLTNFYNNNPKELSGVFTQVSETFCGLCLINWNII